MLDEILEPGIDHFQWANNPTGYDKIHVLERVKVSQKRNKQSTWKILPLVSSTNFFVLEREDTKGLFEVHLFVKWRMAIRNGEIIRKLINTVHRVA